MEAIDLVEMSLLKQQLEVLKQQVGTIPGLQRQFRESQKALHGVQNENMLREHELTELRDRLKGQQDAMDARMAEMEVVVSGKK